ncbi:hypothetical protein HAX54_039068 [Datura stramonium]|uniref:Biogenesis of lysosome-related organelles complex 1 subunit 1 n=1 Tax=Datura stramonium TaxID=4076 RepID=A0ABS8VLE3_DATST|nr:hypothetical protein [Datura stramonium]
MPPSQTILEAPPAEPTPEGASFSTSSSCRALVGPSRTAFTSRALGGTLLLTSENLAHVAARLAMDSLETRVTQLERTSGHFEVVQLWEKLNELRVAVKNYKREIWLAKLESLMDQRTRPHIDKEISSLVAAIPTHSSGFQYHTAPSD